MRSPLFLIGRILFGGLFMLFGLMHLGKASFMAEGVLPGWPMATFFVVVSGVGLIGGGLSIVLWKKVEWVAILLALELLVFVAAVHIPGVVHPVSEKMGTVSMVQVFKDSMLAGAALIMAAVARLEPSPR
jgi:uncharacterized membrane protein YphA (DoxX/SURF4 family)